MKKTMVLLIASVLFTSCSHVYYVQHTHNVPLFNESKEARISGNWNEGYESSSVEIQGAYAVTDHIGIALNAMTSWGGSVEGHNYGRGKYIDAAVGYYQPVLKKIVLETYAGVGNGYQKHAYSDYYDYQNGWARLSYNKIYLQPSVGISLAHCFDAAVSARLALVNFYNVSYYTEDQFHRDDLNYLENNAHIMFEPAFTLRGGWKYFKIQTQLSLIEPLNDVDYSYVEPFQVSMGLYISLGKRFRQ